MIEKENQISRGLSRILEQYKNSPNINKLIEIYGKRMNQFENSSTQSQNKLNIDFATNGLLDEIGDIVGIKRQEVVENNGLNDFYYRIYIRQKIGINSSQITFEDVYNLWRLGIQEDYEVEIKEVYPASVEFYTNAPLNESISLKKKFKEMMEDVIGIGISVGQIVIGDIDRPFAFKDSPTDPNTFGFGDVNDPEPGGYLSNVYYY